MGLLIKDTQPGMPLRNKRYLYVEHGDNTNLYDEDAYRGFENKFGSITARDVDARKKFITYKKTNPNGLSFGSFTKQEGLAYNPQAYEFLNNYKYSVKRDNVMGLLKDEGAEIDDLLSNPIGVNTTKVVIRRRKGGLLLR